MHEQSTATTDLPSGAFGGLGQMKYHGRVESKAGEQYQLSGSMTFEEKESGWNLSKMNFGVTSNQ